MTTVIAVNQTAGVLALDNLSAPDAEIPASGQVTLTDFNLIVDIRADSQLLGYIQASDVLLTVDGNSLNQTQSEKFMDQASLTGPSSTTDRRIVVFDGESGKQVDDSTVLVNTSGQVESIETASYTAEHDNGNQGANWTLDWNNGQNQRVTLTADTASLSITNPPGPATFKLKIIQDATGGHEITWPASVLWPNGNAPNLTNAASAEDIISFYFDGTNYYAVGTLNFQ